MKILALLAFFFVSNLFNDGFDFPALLKKDKEGLRSNHHVGQTNFLKKFDQFRNFDPRTARHTVFYVKNRRLEKWMPKSGYIKSIIKIEIASPVDTVQLIRNNIAINKKIRNSKFVFTAYKFITNTGSFNYITNDSEGLIEYGIGSREFHVSYESIALGINYYDTLKELKSVLKDSKCR